MTKVADWLKELETKRIVLSPAQKKQFEKEAAKAIEENIPYVGVWHYNYFVSRCNCQIAWIYIFNPSEAEWFDGWMTYFIGNGIIIDPESMRKPNLPGVFHCADKRFPEFMRNMSLGPGAYIEFKLPYQVPANIEAGCYLGNVLLIRRSWPFPEFVSGSYGDFEVIICESAPQTCKD